MDLTSVTAAISAASGDITSIGLACLGVFVGMKAFTWIRGALK